MSLSLNSSDYNCTQPQYPPGLSPFSHSSDIHFCQLFGKSSPFISVPSSQLALASPVPVTGSTCQHSDFGNGKTNSGCEIESMACTELFWHTGFPYNFSAMNWSRFIYTIYKMVPFIRVNHLR